MAAWKSWHQVAEAIVLFNDVQPALQSSITRFIPAESHPRIMELVELCMYQKEWCAILNGDIVITECFQRVELTLSARRAQAAVSWRHEFDPNVGLEPRARVDNGLDFFAACPWIWAQVYAAVNENLRLGAIQWDSWMLGFFGLRSGGSLFDITPSRCVCHPLHQGRQYGPAPPPFHLHAWPTMPGLQIS